MHQVGKATLEPCGPDDMVIDPVVIASAWLVEEVPRPVAEEDDVLLVPERIVVVAVPAHGLDAPIDGATQRQHPESAS